MPLDPIAQQQDFSVGAFQAGALERQPDGAAEVIRGLIGDDGLPFRRGGSVYKSTSAAGSGGVSWIADAHLLAGRRTLFGTPGGLYTLDTNDASPLQLTHGTPPNYLAPVRAVVLDGAFYVEPDTTGKEVVWGGSRKAAYSTGTVTAVIGSRTVAGVGTSWLANVEPGMLFGTAGDTAALIESVESDTSLTLRGEWSGGALSGSAYEIAPLHVSSIPNPSPVYYGSVAGRILRTNGPTRMDFSQRNNVGAYNADDKYLFPGSILGFAALRDTALVFTTGGVWAISNMAYSLVDVGTGDPQQRLELVNADMILWDRNGVASWAGALVVPCLDGVYLMDALGAPVPISGRIADLYDGYVRAGHKLGGAEVVGGEYHLPVLNSSNGWVDTLVCRLLASHSGVTFGWSQLDGQGAEVSGFAERSGVLLGASKRSTSRVLSLPYRTSVLDDADGSAQGFTLTTIDYPTGNSVSNFVHRMRLRYSGGPVSAEVSLDGAAFTALTDAASASGVEKVWNVRAHARRVRFRFTATDPLTVKSVEVFVRHSGRQ